jgi:PAS domain S-box-containing protein
LSWSRCNVKARMKVKTAGLKLSTLEQAQLALRESDDRFRELVEHARDACWLVEAESREVLYLNPAFQQVFGLAAAAFENSPADWASICHEADRGILQEAWSSLQGDAEWNVRYRIVRPDGELRWIHERAIAVRDHVGAVYRVAGISEDITEETLAAEQVENYRLRLQELAVRLDSTAESERQEIAETLHDDIGQSLALVRIQLGRLGKRLSEEDRAEIESVSSLVQKTIDSTRSLMLQMSPPALDLGFWPAVDSMATEFSDQAGLQIDLEDHSPQVQLERDTAILLYRSLRELLFNVVRHAKTESARVRRFVEDETLVLQVEDDGVGFAQTDTASPPQSLGLLLCYERTRKLGGSLVIDSAERHGTRVTIAIPLGL